MLTNRLLFTAFLAFLVTGQAFAQSCEDPPVLVDATRGLSTGPSGAPVLFGGELTTLSLAYSGCRAPASLDIQLPLELELERTPEGCASILAPGGGSSLTCRDLPNQSAGADVEHVIEFQVRATPLPAGGYHPVRWEARAYADSANARSGGDSIAAFEGDYSIMSYVGIGQPNGVISVAPGETFAIHTFLEYTDTFMGAANYLPGFSYQSYSSSIPSVACSGGGDTVTCTGGMTGEHSAVQFWVAPMVPGSYSGVYSAEACGPGTPPECATDSVNYTVQVENLGCEFSLSASHQSGYVNNTVYANHPFQYVLDVTAPSGNGANVQDLSISAILSQEMTYSGFSGANWTCSLVGNNLTCAYAGSLAPGQSAPTLLLNMVAPENSEPHLQGFLAQSSTCGSSNDSETISPQPPGSLFANVVSSKTGPATAAVGSAFSWTVTLESEGPNPAEGYEFTDTLPAGVSFANVTADSPLSCFHSAGVVTCSATSLPQGTYSINIGVNAVSAGSATNTCGATATAGATDDAACTDTVDIYTPSADMRITKTGPSQVDALEAFSYQLSVSNHGPGTASSIYVEDVVPSGLVLDSAAGSTWNCSISGNVVGCDYPTSVAPGASIPPIYVHVTAPTEPTNVNNCANVNAAESDPAPVNNSDCLATEVLPVTDLGVIKGGPSSVQAASAIAYSLSVSNAGPSSATDIEVVDTLPAGVSLVSATGAGWNCSSGGGVVTCDRGGSLAGGASAPALTINATAPDEGGEIQNCATVSGSRPDSSNGNNQSCHSINVEPVADVRLVKSGPSGVDAADGYTYDLLVSNHGPSTGTSIVVVDALPTNTTFAGATGSGWACSESSGQVTCSLSGSLASGSTAGILQISAVAPNEAQSLDSCGQVSGAELDPEGSNNEDCHPVEVNAIADLEVAKSADVSEVLAGQPFSYQIHLVNNGPSTASGISISDTLPSGVSLTSISADSPITCNTIGSNIGCSAASLPVGAYVIDIDVVAPMTVGPITNVCVVQTTTDDPNPIGPGECEDDGVIVEPAADIEISKSSTPNPVLAGQPLTYSIAIENHGPQAADDFLVTDTLPAGVVFQSVSAEAPLICSEASGTVSCSASSLPTGRYRVDVVVRAPTEPGPITNTCVIATPTGDPNPPQAGDCEDTNEALPAANLSVEKIPSAANVLAGQPFSYGIHVTNSGPNSATDFVLSDPLPAGVQFLDINADAPLSCGASGQHVTCSASSLPLGSYTIIIDVLAPDEPGPIYNTCAVSSSTGDPDPIGSEDCDDGGVIVDPAADLWTTKVASAPEVLANGEFQYLITLINAGPNAASDLVLTDILPAGVTFLSAEADSPLVCIESAGQVDCSTASLPVGVYSIVLNVQAPSEPGPITNTCVVSSTTEDPSPMPPGTCDDGGVEILPAADLRVSKSSTPNPVLAGQPMTYRITLENLGPQEAVDVVISDTLPSGVSYQGLAVSDPALSCNESVGEVACTASQLDIGSYYVDVEVVAPEEPGPITNTCVITSGTGDPNPPTPADCEDVNDVQPAADLSVTKEASVEQVPAGELFAYLIIVTNSGPNDAENVVVTDSLPDGVQIDGAGSWSNGPFDCAATGSDVVCQAAQLAVGSHQIIINVIAPNETGVIMNTCVVASDTGDPTPIEPGDCDDDGVEILPSADLEVMKTSSEPEVLAGEVFAYTITLTNHGPTEAENASVIDELASELEFVSVVADAPLSCTESAGEVACEAGTLPVGAYEITISVRAPEAPGMVYNTCIAWSDSHDPAPGGDVPPGPPPGPAPTTIEQAHQCDEIPVEVLPAADLRVSKSVVAPPIFAGQPFSYQIFIENLGPNDATDVEVSDPLPTGVSFNGVSSSPEFSCEETSGVVTCIASTLPVGTYTIDIDVMAPDESGEIVNTCVIESITGDPNPVETEDCQDISEVNPAADLSFSKSAHLPLPPAEAPNGVGLELDEVDAGESFIWQIAYENLGPSTAENIVVTDSVPSDFTIESVSGYSSLGADMNCSIGGTHDVTCSLDELPVGEQAYVEIELVAPDQPGSFSNICAYTADTEDPNPSACEDTLEVLAVADLSVTLSAYDDPDAYLADPGSQAPVYSLDAGAEGLYVATVVNSGPSDSEGAELIVELDGLFDGALPAGSSVDECSLSGTVMACSFGDLLVGESVDALVRMMAPEAAVTLVTTAGVSSDTYDSDPGNNTASHTLDIQESPIIGLAKSQSLVEHTGDGQFLTSIVFTLINYGNVPLSDVQVTDDFSETFPAGVAWSIAHLEVNGDLSATNPNYDGTSNINLLSGDETLPVDGEAFIRVDVAFEPGLEAGPFMNQAHALALSTLDIEVTDISTDGMDPNPGGTHPGDYSDPTPIQYDEDPAIGLAKWIEDRTHLSEGQQQIDLAIRLENWGNVPLSNVQVTDDLVYTFTPQEVLNEHGRMARVHIADLVLDDVIGLDVEGDLTSVNPAFDGVNVLELLDGTEALTVGGAATIRFSVLITPDHDDFGPYYNRALGSGWSPGGVRAEDYSQSGTVVNPSGSGDPTDDNEPTPIWALNGDLAVSKVVSTPDTGVGELLSWEVTVTNLGQDSARDVVITDSLPANVGFQGVSQLSGPTFACSESEGQVICAGDALDAGQSATFQIDATAPMTQQNVVNTCEVDSASPDPDLSNNTCVAEFYVGPRAALSIDKVALSPTVLAGERLDYLIAVTNSGPNAALDVEVVDNLPAGTDFVEVASDAPFTCLESGGAVTCVADELPAGTYSIAIGVLAPLDPGPITNTCVIDSGTANPTPIDPEDCMDDSVIVEPAANLAISKSASSDLVAAGSEFSYLIVVDNLGPNEAADVSVSDPLPEGLQLVEVSADAPFGCSSNTGTVTCSAAVLPVGSYLIEVVVLASSPGMIQNVCVLDSATGDPSPVDPADCESGVVEVTPPANVSISKQAIPASVSPGAVFEWVITVDQPGPGDVTGLMIQDDVPPPSAVLGVSGDAPLSCVQDGNLVSCSADVLPPGTYQMVVQTEAPATPGPINNVCILHADQGADQGAGECGGTVEIEERTTLNVDVTSDRSWVDIGEAWAYTVVLQNDGELVAENILMDLDHNGPATPDIPNAPESDGSSCLAGIESGRSECTFPSLAPGESVEIVLPMKASSSGRHMLVAHAATTTLLTPDSSLRGSAQVEIGRGEEIAPHPIPTNEPWALVTLVVLMLLLGGLALRVSGGRGWLER